MVTPKDKKHSGRVVARWVKGGGMKYSEAIQEAVEPQEFYDEWESWKDGMRNYYEDASRFKKNMAPKRFNNPSIEEWEKPDHINKKLTKELRIRKAAKAKQRMKDKNVFIV